MRLKKIKIKIKIINDLDRSLASHPRNLEGGTERCRHDEALGNLDKMTGFCEGEITIARAENHSGPIPSFCGCVRITSTNSEATQIVQLVEIILHPELE